jgi:UDP-3-O-[3-hydroxymyristoyl] N-acetylglucosamine deacetylase
LGIVAQKTLKGVIGCAGVGLNSGERVGMTLHPAAPDSGIVFRRRDLGGVAIAARYDNVVGTMMCTSIGDGNGTLIGTVEHLMAALAGLGVDNVVVELDGPEVPIMDGSAAPFVFLVECAGVVEQNAPRRAIRVLRPVEVTDGDRSITLTPADGFSVSFEIAYPHPMIGRQACYFAFSDGAFKRELARARTYGFLRDVGALKARGLARGGSLDNAVVLDDAAVLNDGGLRYDDELVRHKALDLIGDLYLAGGPILGHIHGVGSGHGMNHRLIEALFADRRAWRKVSLDDTALVDRARWRAESIAASA